MQRYIIDDTAVAVGETPHMKSILVGAIAALAIAFGAYTVLDLNFQQTAGQRFATEGVRL
jgi:hypothetical protein